MKNLLFACLLLFCSLVGQAQTFIPDSGTSDTITKQWLATGTWEVHNDIRSANATPVTLKWKVIYSNFAAGWSESASGVCDNASCRSNITAMLSNMNPEISDPYTTRAGFDVQFVSTSVPAPGTRAVVTILLTDNASAYSRTLTFVEYRSALGVNLPASFDNVTMYPNPANDYLNVLYDSRAGVTNVGIYNLIGKNIQNYKVSNNSSARLDLNTIPSGVYFIRLMNAQGQIITIRRFTRQ